MKVNYNQKVDLGDVIPLLTSLYNILFTISKLCEEHVVLKSLFGYVDIANTLSSIPIWITRLTDYGLPDGLSICDSCGNPSVPDEDGRCIVCTEEFDRVG